MLQVLRTLSRIQLKSRYGAVRHSSSLKDYVAVNEPILSYAPGSQERQDLEASLQKYLGVVAEVPIVIGDEEIHTKDVHYQVMPFDHQCKLAKFSYANKELIDKAIRVSLDAQAEWQRRPLEERCAVYLKAADLLSSQSRMDIVATTMLGQGKTIVQAEVDAAAELIDFYRFDVQFALDHNNYKPISTDSVTNHFKLRGMEGFWAAISPFNFTAIGGHLSAAPTIVGNVSVWKPSDTAMLASYKVYQLLRAAGLPAGVINFVPADGPTFGDVVTKSPDLAGVNFTGSVATFRKLWKLVADNLDNYKTFPRLVGECGGKNFHFVHNSADIESVINGTVLGAFEFSGQKCSACSRMYIPQSIWPEIKDKLINALNKLKVGSPLDGKTFTSAVIDDKAFDRIKTFLDYAKASDDLTVIAGGTCDNSKGYFVEPTIIETTNSQDKIMQEEIFGPVLTVYPYPDEQYKETLELVNKTSPFGLTGSVFSQDKSVIEEASDILINSTGNFYINDKSTGSVVGQQPFGGSRLSGTNDKSGGPNYLLKFCSPQSIKETHTPLTNINYPSMQG